MIEITKIRSVIPKCPMCGQPAITIDSFCSSLCRKKAYEKQGWKEPENPKGWYIATFESYNDVDNYSPEEIKQYNKMIKDAPVNIIKLEKLYFLTSNKEKRCHTKIKKIFPCYFSVGAPFTGFISVDDIPMKTLERFFMDRNKLTKKDKQELKKLENELQKITNDLNRISDELCSEKSRKMWKPMKANR